MFYEYFEKFSVKKDMCTDIPPLNINSTARNVMEIFLEFKTDIVAIVDDNNYVIGIVTRSIMYQVFLSNISLDAQVGSFMKKNVITVLDTYSILDLIENLFSKKIVNAVVVSEENEYLGILKRTSVIKSLKYLYEFYSEEFITLLDTVTNGIVKINQYGKIVLVNPSALDILDIEKDDMIGHPYNLFLPFMKYESWNKITVNNKSIIAKKIPVHHSINKNETLIIFYSLEEFDQISEELKITVELKDTLNTILNSIYDGLLVTNEDNVITYCNEAVCEFLSIPMEGILNNLVTNFLDIGHFNKTSNNIDAITVNNKSCVLMCYPMNNSKGHVIKLIFSHLSQLKSSLFRIDTLEKQLDYYKNKLSKVTNNNFGVERIVSKNEYINYLKNQIKLAAKSSTTILLLGESGTGKEVFSKAIHDESQRTGNFIKVNCAAIPENLLESEFFGYTDGAFTGAKKGGKIGKFQMADKGTLFLDEIGDMSPSLQAKILRVLQDQEFEQVGGIHPIKVDARIIAATNQDLKKLVREGKFREDLYYRLNVIPMEIPPLRKRPDDILPIAEFLISKFNKKLGIVISAISPDAAELLEKYDWPGNVRELENILERVLSLNVMDVLLPEHILPHLNFSNNYTIEDMRSDSFDTYEDTLDVVAFNEKKKILSILDQVKGNRSKAAKLLNMSRTTFYVKIAKYNIR